MIIVIGMVQVFLSEMKLSRYQYDYIIASEQVEWAFEYAMLKVGNHRDWFQDELTENDLDQILFSGSTDRTINNKVSYKMQAQTSSYSKDILPWDYLVFPLFAGDDEYIVAGKPSKNPSYHSWSTVVSNFLMSLSSNPEDIYWSIIGMSGSVNSSLSWTGQINGSEVGTSRMVGIECFDNSWAPVWLINNTCPPWVIAAWGEELQYFYDNSGSVDDFLKIYWSWPNAYQITDPYFFVFNKWTNTVNVTFQSSLATPFALPDLTILVEAKKWKAVQTIRFHSDKSKYYDGLKYSLYDTH